MSTLMLIHGGGHGSWVWGRLIPELDDLDHEVLTVDLPVSDPDVGIEEYAALVVAGLEGRDDAVIVGHSMAGYVLPFVANLTSLKMLVFLAGNMQSDVLPGLPPGAGASLLTPDSLHLGDDGLYRMTYEGAALHLYSDASPSMQRWAVSQMRPQAARPMSPERVPAFDLTTPVASIVCQDDHGLSPAWLTAAARDALHVDPVFIDGGHSPFLTRPRELARVMHRILQDAYT